MNAACVMLIGVAVLPVDAPKHVETSNRAVTLVQHEPVVQTGSLIQHQTTPPPAPLPDADAETDAVWAQEATPGMASVDCGCSASGLTGEACSDCEECQACDDCKHWCGRHFRRWDSTCNMPQHMPYDPMYHGYFTYRPYNYRHVLQAMQDPMIGDPIAPYFTSMFRDVYLEFKTEFHDDKPMPPKTTLPRTSNRLPNLQELVKANGQ